VVNFWKIHVYLFALYCYFFLIFEIISNVFLNQRIVSVIILFSLVFLLIFILFVLKKGNLDEWVSDVLPNGHGIFKGGFFVDAHINGEGNETRNKKKK